VKNAIGTKTKGKPKSRPRIRAKPGVQKKQTDAATVVDLFCGVGGLSHGFVLEGFKVVAGVDLDPSCQYAFEANNKAKFIRRDVSKVKPSELLEMFGRGPKILIGCAPCQPFSTYAQKHQNSTWKLLRDFGRLILACSPDVVSMENVPRLVGFRNGKIFGEFVTLLEDAGYDVSWTIAYAPDYGVPQQRSRLVMLASKHGPIELEPPTVPESKHRTVRDVLASLPALAAGDVDESDSLHRCSRLSSLNGKRIRAAKPGGTWRDWKKKDLVAPCHQEHSGKTYVSVYGRMSWDEPAPTITTQFYGFGNGRFGHPEQNRAISLREGALLQSFPRSYHFVEKGEPVHFKRLGKLIGNAVPVLLGRAIARTIKNHLAQHEAEAA
jgi:DNA (cytosine-5)-methyltransferase 1